MAMTAAQIKKQLKRKTETVKVVVRCRPLSQKELKAGRQKIVQVDRNLNEITLHKPPNSDNPGPKKRTFTFDHVYDENALQKEIYNETARPIIDSVISGYNGTVFAYGQTGTGKTFTMEGVPDDDSLRGIMPNSFHHIFEAVQQSAQNVEFLVRASFLEIYNDEVYDLLNRKTRSRMQVRESKDRGIFVAGLSAFGVKCVPDLMKVLKKGQKSRQVGATAMNPGSSRSHSILTITIETSETDAEDVNHYKMGKLNMVDLAGSERQKKTESTGQRLDEAKAINLSLAALGNVIKALVNPMATHVPFRDSKLTRLLQDSLGGNTKTVMIANVGPADYNFDETMNTLRYANRAKEIKNKPKINEDPKDAMLRQYQEEILALKKKLEERQRNSQGLGPSAPLPANMRRSASNNKIIEEKIVVKEIVKDTGISEEELKKIEQMSKEEQERFAAMSEMEQKQALQAKMEAEEAERVYREEAAAKQAQFEKEKQELEKLEFEIQQKEAKLLQGRQQTDFAEAQKKQLEQTEAELNAQREAEEKLHEELEEAEERELYMNEQFHSRKEELEQKTKIIKKLWTRCQAKVVDLEDIESEFELEREELVNTIRELDRQIKLKNLVLNSFIPPHQVDLIENHAQYDTFNGTWSIPYVQYTGNHIARPRSRASSYGRADSAMLGAAGMTPGHMFNPDAMGAPMPTNTEVFLSYKREPKSKAPRKKGGRKRRT